MTKWPDLGQVGECPSWRCGGANRVTWVADASLQHRRSRDGRIHSRDRTMHG